MGRPYREVKLAEKESPALSSLHVKDAFPPPPVVAFVQANELNSPAPPTAGLRI